MPKKIELTGKRFGKIKVVSKKGIEKGCVIWNCVCDCGKELEISTGRLNFGNVKSCGCVKRQMIIERNTTHGKSKTRLYEIWVGMKKRCYNPKSKAYERYGGRGITICPEWLDDFMNFYNWSMANGYSDDLSIDRINVNGNYEPDNCRWSTRKEQSCNTRRTKLFNHNGKAKTLKQISLDEKINYNTLLKKVSENGNDVDKAIYEIKNRIRIKRKKV